MKVNWVTVFMDKEEDASAPTVRFSEAEHYGYGIVELFESEQAAETQGPHITLFTKDVGQSFSDFLQNVAEGLAKFRTSQEEKEKKAHG